MNKKTISLLMLLTLTFSLLTASAHADSDSTAMADPLIEFPGDPTYFDSTINSDEQAVFELTVKNNDATTDFELSVQDDKDWDIEFSETEFSTSTGDTDDFNITFTPPENIGTGTYKFVLVAMSGEETLGSEGLEVSVSTDIQPIKLNSFELEKDKILPGKPVGFSIVLYNNNFEPEKNIRLEIESGALASYFSVVKTFEGKETKTITGELVIAEQLDAGNYDLTVEVLDSKKYEVHQQTISIPKEGSMDVEKDVDYSFLKSTHKITITNLAKYPLEDTYELELGSVTRFFTFVEPGADKTEGSTHIYDVDLAAGESMTITYSVSYIPLLIGLALIGLLILWFYSRKKCSIKKRVTVVKKKKGKKGLVKVTLRVKNRTHKAIKKLKVTERVPASLKVVHKASAMKPDIIKKHKTHAKLAWKIPKLSARETRVISYYLKANVKMIGKVSLPPAELTFKPGRKSRERYTSNSALIKAKP